MKSSEKKYSSNHNVVHRCHYHAIWCVKYRRRLVAGKVAGRLHEIIHEVASECQSTILALGIVSDHVHLLCQVDPQFGVNRLIRRMKGRSSRLLRLEYPWLKKHARTLWTNSYFVTTVGEATLEGVTWYVRKQRKRHGGLRTATGTQLNLFS